MHKRLKESGAVSLFLVIFAMLLITVITLSFLRVMVKDQAASSVSDLSQSAYDSAAAGTEDAKRELIYYRTLCANNGATSPLCTNAATAINSTNCNTGLGDVVTVLDSAGNPVKPTADTEVPVAQTTGDKELNQAYTCVKMQLDTDNYEVPLDPNESKVVPLQTTKDFSTVTVNWFDADNIPNTSKAVSLVGAAATTRMLYSQTAWVSNRPSVLRVQLMQYGTNFKLSDFDNTAADGKSDANTLFLYPTSNGLTGSVDFAHDARKTAPTGDNTTTIPVKCSANLSAGGYACSMTLNLPTVINPNPTATNQRTAYLRLTSLYNAADVSITFTGADAGVKFRGVQPAIDATGRANDQYRRVYTRVNLVNTDFAYPEAAVDVTGNLCKDFAVTDSTDGYNNTCTITP